MAMVFPPPLTLSLSLFSLTLLYIMLPFFSLRLPINDADNNLLLVLWRKLFLNPVVRHHSSSWIETRKISEMKLRNSLIRFSKWVQVKVQFQAGYSPLRRPSKPKIIGKLADGDPFPKETVRVPRGHLAVYVGQKDGDFHRILVPVVYFNHPLFNELLMEAEEEFGFEQPGGITIPCGFAKFDRIQTRIKTGSLRANRCGGPALTAVDLENRDSVLL